MKISQGAMAVDWNPSLTLIQPLVLRRNTESDVNGNISGEVKRPVDK